MGRNMIVCPVHKRWIVFRDGSRPEWRRSCPECPTPRREYTHGHDHRPGESFEAEADGMGESRVPRFARKR